MNITELRCPGCGSTLRMPPGGSQVVRCEYCGGEYAVNWYQGHLSPRKAPDWRPALPPVQNKPKEKSSPAGVILCIAILAVCAAGLYFLIGLNGRNHTENRTEEVFLDIDGSDIAAYGSRKEKEGRTTEEQTAEPAALTGLLREAVTAAFGKDADMVTAQELSRIRWIADKRDFDYFYIGYSFDDPLEDPDAEIEWLAFPDEAGDDYESGYEGLRACTGLKKLETKRSLSQCDLSGLKLESLSASFGTLEEAAAAVDDPSLIRELGIERSMENLMGLEQFPNLEKLSIDASKLGNLNAVTALPHLTGLTLKNADQLSDFAVFGSMDNLEELSIESENLKALNFLGRIPQLKSLALSDGKLLDLNGIEVLENLERLSVTDCRELQDMKAVEGLTGLKELTLEKPYDCEEPSLAALTGLEKLTLMSFHSCGFLQDLTGLKKLTLQSCDLPAGIDLSGLTQLKELTCTTSLADRSFSFVGRIPSLETVNMKGIVTYEDISGIFALPNLKKLDLSGAECEIAFDKVPENTSLESLEMAGIKLYENVSVYSDGFFTEVYWDDVYLADHTDFFGRFPHLKKLNIAGNEIKDLNFAESLGKLEEIDFSDNYVTEMRPLAALPSLRLVNCKGNPIGNLQVLDERVFIIKE